MGNITQEPKKNREGESGAALITVLLVSFLLLTVVGALLFATSLNAANMTDAVAEQQAYYASESGIQTALNALRGNVSPNPVFVSPATSPANRIDFRKVTNPTTSNTTGDTSTNARLSRWLDYNYTPSGQTLADRIVIGLDDPSNYNTQRDMAFSVRAIDPDQTQFVSFSTSCNIAGGTNGIISLGTATVIYNQAPNTNLTINSGAVNTSFGSFTVINGSTGLSIPEPGIRFTVNVNMTRPFLLTKSIRGFIKGDDPATSNVEPLRFVFDSSVFSISGGTITLPSTTIVPGLPASTNTITGTMSAPEPRRIVLRSTGYGPRGAQKQLDVIIRKNLFNDLSAPATLTLVGSNSGFVFEPGTSQNVVYSGDDVVSTAVIPPVGTTNANNLATVNSALSPGGSQFKGDVAGYPSDVSDEMPDWLTSPAALDQTLAGLKTIAASSNRYFGPGVTPPDVGNIDTATGITYCDGDASLNQSGGGILVVTGTLTLRGAFDFKGLIIVTGAGGLVRAGGGNGSLQGNVVVAPYVTSPLGTSFLGPKYDMRGGGTSEIQFNSSSIDNGLDALKGIVLGVAEK